MRERRVAQPGRESPQGEVALEQAEFLRALAPAQLARVRPMLRERRFGRQRQLFCEGEEAEWLWVLRRGQVRLYKASPSGRVTTLETLAMEAPDATVWIDEDRLQATGGVAAAQGQGADAIRLRAARRGCAARETASTRRR